jgi:Periplasmic glycine betaine/choline-binding (lipo)protein of an ABC-type transport system (osmoprotectant binding protein)
MLRTKMTLGAVVAAAALAVAACGGSSNPASTTTGGGTKSSAPTDTIVVGSANFQENVILADIYAEALKAKGVKVSTKLNIGSREAYIPGLKDGSIDLIPDYSGNLLLFLDKTATAISADDIFTALKTAVPAPLTVLDKSAAEDKDAIVVSKETAAKYKLTSIADLAKVAGKLTFGGPPEMKTRSYGVPGFKKNYGVVFGTYKTLDAGGPLSENALKNGQVDAADIFTTDPLIKKNGWVALEDPKNNFIAQNVLPLINKAKATATVTSALNAVSAKLTTQDLIDLRTKVEVNKQDPDAAAKAWLSSKGLI